MKNSDRFLAVIAYLLPIVGWLYVGIFQRKKNFAMFHLRQAVGIFLAIVIAFLAWMVVGWVLTWIPFLFILSMVLFSLVIMVVILAVVAWITGIINSLRLRSNFVPIFGRWASRLPI